MTSYWVALWWAVSAFTTVGHSNVDVVTVGKVLQGSATLFTQRYNPRPGLIAGTYAGSTVGMAVGARIIERLESDGYLGEKGRIAVLARLWTIVSELAAFGIAVLLRGGLGKGETHPDDA